MSDSPKTSVSLAPGEGTSFAAGPSTVTIKAGSDATAGTFAVLEYQAAAGFPGPGRHVHPSFDECFYVLEGKARFALGEETVEMGAGGCVFVAGDQPHTFGNPFDEPLRMLMVCRPGGFDRFVADVADGVAGGHAADPEFMPQLWQRYGMSPAD